MSFPDGFAWGTATASYQIEGAVAEGGRSKSIWDTFSHTPGKVDNGDTGDVADDHYHRYAEDIGHMVDMGIGWYRFSLAWPRIQPAGRGALNQQGLDFYARLIEALLEKDIRPWVTLYHWDLPQVLEDAGGWPNRDTAERFAEYAAATHEALGDRVQHWTTLNEPWCSSILGYGAGAHAPGRTNDDDAIKASHHLLLGHGLAVAAMRAQEPSHAYGITLNLSPTDPASDDPKDVDAARRADGIANRHFLDPLFKGSYPDDLGFPTGHVLEGDLDTISADLDFFGVNYYFRTVVTSGEAKPHSIWPFNHDIEPVERGLPTTDMGWEIDAPGLYDLLTRVARDYPGVPLYVTENGAAFDTGVHDTDRVEYLRDHFAAAERAIADGVDLRGYFVWSLLDNFEWAYGYSKRFGLIHVDYETLERTPKDSAVFYAAVTRANGLPA
ncbi:GH1 family beta-glucosidase [Solirubrobacter soli]|uniref:GH1 family beta-glucosidase n=1 Tax=Solirubrobacter soli TaxID=363832 RepID=UPI00056256E9|nr:GH1 family beta-glucosidase [Solirubrobacter soli]